MQNEIYIAEIFKTSLTINDAKARFRIILKQLFEKSSILFNDIKMKQQNHYFKPLTRRYNHNHRRRLNIKDKQYQFKEQCIILLSSDNIKNSLNTAIMKRIIMHLALMTLFLIERKEKKLLIIQSEDLARDEYAFKMKTMNDVNFTKFINLAKTELDFDSNDEDVIYRSNIDDFAKIINDR